MRELKFRAWDGAQMLTALIINENPTKAGQNVFDMYPHKLSKTHPKAHKFMQYTGLKDKHGVEIYEGDFVHCSSIYHDPYLEFTGIVAWQSDSCDYDIEDLAGDHVQSLGMSGVLYKVVGNVYENSNLLKGDLR